MSVKLTQECIDWLLVNCIAVLVDDDFEVCPVGLEPFWTPRRSIRVPCFSDEAFMEAFRFNLPDAVRPTLISRIEASEQLRMVYESKVYPGWTPDLVVGHAITRTEWDGKKHGIDWDLLRPHLAKHGRPEEA
jgi:hypothetical protein